MRRQGKIQCACVFRINIEQTNLAKRFVGKIMQCDNNMREIKIYRRRRHYSLEAQRITN